MLPNAIVIFLLESTTIIVYFKYPFQWCGIPLNSTWPCNRYSCQTRSKRPGKQQHNTMVLQTIVAIPSYLAHCIFWIMKIWTQRSKFTINFIGLIKFSFNESFGWSLDLVQHFIFENWIPFGYFTKLMTLTKSNINLLELPRF